MKIPKTIFLEIVDIFFSNSYLEAANTSVQTRFSSRLKEKHGQTVETNEFQTKPRRTTTPGKAGARSKRHLSTELMSSNSTTMATTSITTNECGVNTNDFLNSSEFRIRSLTTKILTTSETQTNDDFVEISHQSIQTNQLLKSDKSTCIDFIDQPLCENSTQTIEKQEQETQTTDLNYPNDSHVYLYDLKDSQNQCDDSLDIHARLNASSPSSLSSSPGLNHPTLQIHNQQQNQQVLSSPYIDFSLTNSNNDRIQIFQTLIHTEEHPNGGASLVRTYYNEFLRLSDENAHLFVNYFFNLVYGEINQRAKYSIGVLHDGARYLPDLVEYFSLTYPKMVVKTSNMINSKEVLTTTMGEYRNRLVQTYSNGTFRHGPLLSISLVGKMSSHEECGRVEC